MPLMHMPPLMMSAGRLKSRCQSVVNATAARCAARGLATDIKPVRIAAETRDVLVDPGDCAADLIGEHHQIAADILHPVEIGDDVMRPGGEEHLGR